MELTKEYFDKKFEGLDRKFAAIDQKFDAQTKELKAFAREQTEELARMVKNGFDHVDLKLAIIVERLDEEASARKNPWSRH
jgi:hypothetical protein